MSSFCAFQLIAMALFMCIWVALAVFTVLNCCQVLDNFNGGKQSDQKDHEMTANKGHSKETNNEGHQLYVNERAIDDNGV